MSNHSFSTTTLGEYVFPFNPKMNTIRKQRDVASVGTYSGAQASDWGFKAQQQGLIGSTWDLEWDMITGAFWTQLYNYYLSDEPITWDPKERAHSPGARYIVNIVEFEPDDDHRIVAYDRVSRVKISVNVRSVV